MSKAKPQPEKPKTFNHFICDSCKDAVAMELKEFKEHLASVHGIDATNFKGRKQMVMHMDGADWYASNFKWTLEGGLIFHQHVQNARGKSDPMRFE